MTEIIARELCQAIESRDEPQVRRLMMRVDSDSVNIANDEGLTALHVACKFSNDEAISKLLDIPGVNVGAFDQYRCTPLHYVDRLSNLQTVDKLLNARGADVNATNVRGGTPLHNASYANNYRVVSKLASIPGIKANVSDARKYTPLHYACQEGNTLVVAELLRVDGINVNLKDRIGMTPVMLAAEASAKGLLELMVKDQRVDLEVKTNHGGGLENILSEGGGKESLAVVKEEKMRRRSRDAKLQMINNGNKVMEQNAEDMRANIRNQYIQRIGEVNQKIEETKQTLTRKKKIKDKKMKKLIKKQDLEKEVAKQKLFEEKTALEEEMARIHTRIIEMEERGKMESEEMEKRHLLNKLTLENQSVDYENLQVLNDLMKTSDELAVDLEIVDMDPEANAKLEKARGILECPVCMEMMMPPKRIWMCSESHSVCEECKNKLTGRKCPTCRTKKVTLRAYIVESFASALNKQ